MLLVQNSATKSTVGMEPIREAESSQEYGADADDWPRDSGWLPKQTERVKKGSLRVKGEIKGPAIITMRKERVVVWVAR